MKRLSAPFLSLLPWRCTHVLTSVILIAAAAWPASAAGVTFLVTSDSHYDAFENEDRNERDRVTIDEMNRITNVRWPESLGGAPIARPRGVALLGDVIDDGDRMKEGKNQSRRQFDFFVADFGLDGTEGRLKYPVFEGWGNHDGPPVGREQFGFSFQSELKRRNAIRLQQGLITNLSENGLHYCWDWDGVHFVQLNLYPGNKPHPKIRYSAAYHDPQHSLDFLEADLASHVASSGRPVVIMHHYDLQGTDWWHDEQRRDYYDAIKEYNVVAVFHGHTGTGVYRWKPEGEPRALDVINTGQTENGFFVAQITDDRLRLAYRMKEGVKRTKQADGSIRHQWDGTWGWRHVLAKEITTPDEPTQRTYTNPVIDEIGPADPTVIFYQGKYYLYPTGDNHSYHVYYSTDLVHWTKGPRVFEPGERNVWAPDVFRDPHDGKFYLYYTVNRRIGVAVADRPDAKFVDQASLFTNAIDAHMFYDGGKYFLYYVQLPGFRICVQPMESPLEKRGQPIEIIRPTEPWEMKSGAVTEGPWMLKHDGTYYLLYSGTGASSLDYAIGYATAADPTGPFKKHPGNPIVARGNGALGPGHGCVIRDAGGNMWSVYHQQKDDSQPWNRFLCIDPLWFDQQGVLHGKATRGTPQPAPIVAGQKGGPGARGL